MPEKNLRSGYLIAKKITRHYARTFYLASLFLPKDKRLASYAVYAICRISDEKVDNPTGIPCASDLRKLREEIASAYSDSTQEDALLLALADTLKTYSIPNELFFELINGMQMDLDKSRYADFEALRDYCYKAAGVVGLIMLKILGSHDPKAEKCAVDLGIAMQLTNILRDLKEDYARGRIYLPREDMARFKVSEKDIAEGKMTNELKLLIKFQIQRSKKFYADSEAGIPALLSRRARFVTILMKDMYCAILEVIRKNDYDVFSKRLSVGPVRKLNIILTTLLQGKYL